MPVYHLIYRSTDCLPFGPAQLDALLRRARAFNQAHGITGILLYDGARFMQVLEGQQLAVQPLYARICQDARHDGVRTLTEGLTGARIFPRWSMGYLATSAEEFGHLAGFVDPRRAVPLLPHARVPLSAGPGLLALLQELATARIVQF